MYYYKAVISYKGTQYFGWQSQPEEEKNTVQDTLYQVLRRISKYKECRIVGASRTDAGVHAQGQVAKISLPKALQADKLLLGMNSMLPKDIRVIECETCPGEFNPIKDAKTKEYHYYFSMKPVESPLLNDMVNYVSVPLDFELMKQGAKMFVGKHDFFNFSRRDSNALTTFRTITACDIQKGSFAPFDSSVYVVKVEGTGFLKQMVRYMVGSLFELGQKNISIQALDHYLNEHQEDKLSSSSKAKGLHLVNISY